MATINSVLLRVCVCVCVYIIDGLDADVFDEYLQYNKHIPVIIQ